MIRVGGRDLIHVYWQSADEPAPVIMTAPSARVGASGWIEITNATNERTMKTSKPPFTPLTMAQVAAAPLTGLTHVSTFSGAGGSCLGFRLAGFRTLWANDIEDHARACYSANLESPIDGRDIRHLTAADILAAISLAAGALDVFEGSPPCTAFSTAGKRAKGWNQTKDHAGHVQTNVEDLFYEWLRLLDGLRPRAFVAENVAGLVKGVSKGYFKDILRRMKALGYRTEARLLDAQWLGVPQQRCRVIFVGLRDDLGVAPTFPAPWAYRYSVRDALPWITTVVQDPPFGGTDFPAAYADHGDGSDTGGFAYPQCKCHRSAAPCADRPRSVPRISSWRMADRLIPIRKPSAAGTDRRKFTIAELKRICSFPDDYVMTGSYAQQWARLGNSVPPLMAQAIAASLRDVLLSVQVAA